MHHASLLNVNGYLLQIGNIRLKNADGMPLIMLLGTLACCACWLVYGLLLDDPNIYVCIYD